ncbi:MAG: pilus assembly protein N-terminal domain-containing protein, partial [Terriglobales bacterium]
MSIRSRVWEKCEAKTNCARPAALLITLLVTALLVAPIASKGQEQTAPPTATPPPAQAAPEQTQVPGPEANSQAPQAEAQGAAPLRVLVGKSLLINTTERLKRISVTDDAIADALVVT